MKKQIGEMSHEEIINLSESDIQELVELKCADEGIKILPKPKKPEELKVASEPVDCAYVIGDFIVATNIESAQAIQSCLKAHKDHIVNAKWAYLEGLGDYYACVDQQKNFNISEVPLVSSDMQRKFISLKEKRMESMAEYNKKLQLFLKSDERVREIANYITSVYAHHQEIDACIRDLKYHLRGYYFLAKGNIDIALRFFNNVYRTEYDKVKEYFNVKNYITKLANEEEGEKDANTTDPNV